MHPIFRPEAVMLHFFLEEPSKPNQSSMQNRTQTDSISDATNYSFLMFLFSLTISVTLKHYC